MASGSCMNKEIFRKILGLKRPLPFEGFKQFYFGQEGEDIILKQILEQISSGFYVDVGAHHPFKYSNTLKFYLEGWSGINIDPLPGIMNEFRKYRPKDINLEIGVAEKKGKRKYYMFSLPELNGFSRRTVLNREEALKYPLEKIIKIEVLPLSEIFKTYLPQGKEISFLSIDVEGSELSVLKSNNWQKYRPKVICLEIRAKAEGNKKARATIKYLISKKYFFYTKTKNSLFFLQND